MTFYELTKILERLLGKQMSSMELHDLYIFSIHLSDNFNVIKNYISDIKLLREESIFADFKLQYLEKLKFLPFIKDDIFPINAKTLCLLKLNEYLSGNEILKIELADRLYTLFLVLKKDLFSDDIISNHSIRWDAPIYSGKFCETFKTINIQHLYSDFSNIYLKKQILMLHRSSKIDFNYDTFRNKYSAKHIAMYNASRVVSSIDFFFPSKIFIYRKRANTSFSNLNIKFKENNIMYSGILSWLPDFVNLSTGWNIIISPEIMISDNPYNYVCAQPCKNEFYGKNVYRDIIDNSNYKHNLFTKSSKYLNIDYINKRREDCFDNTFLLKILNHIQSYPISVDRLILEKAKKIMVDVLSIEAIDLLKKEIDKKKIEKNELWKNSINFKKNQSINSQLKSLFNKLEGFEVQNETFKKIFKFLNILDGNFYFRYALCTRYRMYPDAGPLNYQNFALLRLLMNGGQLEKKIIIKSYRSFFEKHINYLNELNQSMFFYNKIKKENAELLVKIVNNKLGTNYRIHNKNILELNDNALWENLVINYVYHLIYRIGEFTKKTSTSISNDQIFSNGINIIQNECKELLSLKNIDVYEKLYWERLADDWFNFNNDANLSPRLYSFDVTTSMVQISSIIAFAENEKILKQCGLIDPFIDDEIIEDAHQTIVIKCIDRFEEFIEKNNAFAYKHTIFKLINRSFIKTIHIPYGYGQSNKTLVQALNAKHKNNETWNSLPKLLKSSLAHHVYNIISEIYKKNLPHIQETKISMEIGYTSSSISIGGEMLKMPVEADISDDHIEYSALSNKIKSLSNHLAKIKILMNRNEDLIINTFYEEKIKEIVKKLSSLRYRLEKLEDYYDKNDLIKRINISSVAWDKNNNKYKSINKYKVTFLDQQKRVNMKKMNRCSYVNSIQNGDATAMLLTNDNLIFETKNDSFEDEKNNKITVLWSHDCGSISLWYGDILEAAYKISINKIIDFYIDPNSDPLEKPEYAIDHEYLRKRKIRKEKWISKNLIKRMWESSRLIVSEI